jgi:HEAT repeat protein
MKVQSALLVLGCSLVLTACARDTAPTKSSSRAQPTAATVPTQRAPEPPSFWEVRHKNRTIRQWYDRARDKDLIKPEREEAFRQLGLAGQPGAAALWELLGAADADTVRPLDPQRFDPTAVAPGWVRWKSAETLGRLGQLAQPAAPRLAELMQRDPEVQVRATAAAALAGIGSRDPSVVKALKEVLRGKDLHAWQGAVSALAQVQPRDQETTELLQKLADADPYKLGRNDFEWAAVMNARMAARAALLKR